MIQGVIDDSPSLRNEFAGLIEKVRSAAARSAGYELSPRGETAKRLPIPDYTVEQILGDWLPKGQAARKESK